MATRHGYRSPLQPLVESDEHRARDDAAFPSAAESLVHLEEGREPLRPSCLHGGTDADHTVGRWSSAFEARRFLPQGWAQADALHLRLRRRRWFSGLVASAATQTARSNSQKRAGPRFLSSDPSIDLDA